MRLCAIEFPGVTPADAGACADEIYWRVRPQAAKEGVAVELRPKPSAQSLGTIVEIVGASLLNPISKLLVEEIASAIKIALTRRVSALGSDQVKITYKGQEHILNSGDLSFKEKLGEIFEQAQVPE